MQKPKNEWRAALALFSLFWLILAWPWLSGAVTVPWDAKAHFFPQFSFLAHALRSGQNPAWTPNVFAGSPQIADPQSLIFAPAYFLAALLRPEPSFQLADGVEYAMLALGAFGVFLYFSDRGWRMAGAAPAALSFAFGGGAAWRIQHVGQVLSLSWFMLAFALLARALDRKNWLSGVLAGGAAGFMVLGRDQIAWLGVLILSAFVIFRIIAEWRGFQGALANFRPLGGGLAAGLIVALIPVLLTVALAEHSNRPALDYDDVLKGSFPPGAFLTLFSADLFGIDAPLAQFWGPPSPAWGETGLYIARNMATIYLGAAPIAALAAFGGRIPRRDRDVYFILGAVFISILYALGKYTPVFHLLFLLPGGDLWRRPADAVFPFCAGLSLLGGYAIHRLIEHPETFRLARGAVLIAAAFALCACVAVSKDRLAQAAPPLLLGLVFFFLAFAALLYARRARKTAYASLIVLSAVVTLDLAISARPNESTGLPAADYDALRPDTTNATIALLKEKLAASHGQGRRDRMELAGVGFAWPNAGLVHRMDNDLGYNPIRLDLFESFTHAEDHVALPEQRVFSPAFPSYRSIAADLMGLRYIATGVPVERIDKTLKPDDLIFVGRTSDAYVYENPRAMPRAWVASWAQAADFQKILTAGDWPAVDYAQTVLLKPEDFQPDGRAHPPGTARISAYGDSDVVIDVSSPEGGYLVFADIYHPWWRCRIDGVEAPILQANVAFRAVKLPPGDHRAHFEFAPIAGLIQQIQRGLLRRD